jgi:NADH:ubiquinone oxidoreductase subunit
MATPPSSLLSRALARLFPRARLCVGGDASGNLYYARTERDDEGGPVERREVRPPSSRPSDFDSRTVPAEWSAWLRATRADPPTPEEIASNEARRERTRELAASVDARAAAARAARLAAGAPEREAPRLEAGEFAAGEWEPPARGGGGG